MYKSRSHLNCTTTCPLTTHSTCSFFSHLHSFHLVYFIVHRNCLLRVQCYRNAVQRFLLVRMFPTVAVMRQDPKRMPLAADWRGRSAVPGVLPRVALFAESGACDSM